MTWGSFSRMTSGYASVFLQSTVGVKLPHSSSMQAIFSFELSPSSLGVCPTWFLALVFPLEQGASHTWMKGLETGKATSENKLAVLPSWYNHCTVAWKFHLREMAEEPYTVHLR